MAVKKFLEDSREEKRNRELKKDAFNRVLLFNKLKKNNGFFYFLNITGQQSTKNI